jgi:surface polysaccharide O-acyltransferase-like enzyme
MLTGALLLQPSKVDEPIRVFFRKRWNRIGVPLIFWGITYFAWRFSVRGEALSLDSVVQGLLAGPYVHFWFLYLLIGLYFLTPIIRLIVAHADWKIIRYFLLIWFVGTGIIPLLTLYPNISPQTVWFQHNIFMWTGMLGYFMLGPYVAKLRFRFSMLFLMLNLSSVCTIVRYLLLSRYPGREVQSIFPRRIQF